MVVEIKSFDLILLTRLKLLQELLLWTLILKLRILQACSMQSSDDGVQQLIGEAHGTREEPCFQL